MRLNLRVVGVPRVQGHLRQELSKSEEQVGAAALWGRCTRLKNTKDV
jgi:hypothetical protein